MGIDQLFLSKIDSPSTWWWIIRDTFTENVTFPGNALKLFSIFALYAWVSLRSLTSYFNLIFFLFGSLVYLHSQSQRLRRQYDSFVSLEVSLSFEAQTGVFKSGNIRLWQTTTGLVECNRTPKKSCLLTHSRSQFGPEAIHIIL